MNDKPLPSLLDLTPLNETYRIDPHEVLDDLRARCPAHRDPLSGSLILTRYEDVRAVVNNRSLWRDGLREETLAMSGAMARARLERADLESPRSHITSILTLDDPDHARIRQPLAQALYARVARFRPILERLVDDVLDRILGETEFDLMARFCVPIPIEAIAKILGVDEDRLDEFRAWSEGLIQGLNPFRTPEQTAEMERASAALTAYFTQIMAARRSEPRDDLISDMVHSQAGGADLSDVELRINLTALLVGGNLTTTDLIGNGVRHLLLNPSELEKLRADPNIIAAVVEEALRFDPPIDVTGRFASADGDVAGQALTKGQSITVSLRAANRDPAIFEDPHRFDVSRPHRPHIAFGGGAHICIGSPLARLEAQVALAKLFARFPHLRLARPDDPPAWRKMPFFRGLERLPVQA